VKALAARFGTSRPLLAWKRYADARGNVLAAGVGYFAFFSIFPAAALAFAVFGFVLRGHPDLLRSVYEQLGAYLPGLIRDAQHPDGLLTIQAPPAAALTITGVIAFLALVLGGLGWLGATREGVRAVFGVPGSAGNLITNKARDLGVLFTLGLGIAVFAVLSTGVGAAGGWVAERVGLSGEAWILTLGGFAVSVLADTALMIILLRVVSGLQVPWRDLSQGALMGGVGLSLLKFSAATLLPRLTANPLFASFAVVVGLLVWLNLIARLTLISAAWAANDVEEIYGDAAQVQIGSSGQRLHPGPGAGARADAHTGTGTNGMMGVSAARDRSLPTFGARSGDRATLGAGLVLGAAGMAASGVLARGIRSVARLVRG
jgi:membrane protein